MNERHAALLLAAGGSRRLGRSKALLLRNGEALVRRVAGLLLDTGPGELVVVTGADAVAVEAALEGLPLRCVRNDAWASGLAGSLQAGAAALSHHAGSTLVATVDQPALDASHLQALLHADASFDVASAYADTVGVPARIRAATLRQASTLSGDRGFGALWRRASTPPLRIDNPGLAFDIDTPDDLARAIREGWLDPQ